jgi:Tfp pilus assembly protein PilF
MIKKPEIVGILALAALVATAPQAHAGVSVFGGGLGADCYKAVKDENVAFTRARDICDLALIEEQMSIRDKAATYINRGILYMRQKQNERALQDYERAIELNANMPEAHINEGAALYSLGRYDEAMKAVNAGMTTVDPLAKAVGHYNRALIHERNGDVTAAYYDYKAAVDLKPEFTEAAKALTRFQVQVVPAS